MQEIQELIKFQFILCYKKSRLHDFIRRILHVSFLCNSSWQIRVFDLGTSKNVHVYMAIFYCIFIYLHKSYLFN